MLPLHDRMAAILDRAGISTWLYPSSTAEQLQALPRPAPADVLERYAVGRGRPQCAQ